MVNATKDFGDIAKGLAKNPLGIIALFIVLVYGFAAMVTAFGGSLTASERLPLIYFLVFFPVLVLSVFTWLVINHSPNFYSPGDFKNEDNYVRLQMKAVASLAVASVKSNDATSDTELRNIVNVVRDVAPVKQEDAGGWRSKILWTDDNPDNNIYERKTFEAIGISFTLAKSTDDALDLLKHNKYAAIISDMGRREGDREGYVLLDAIRNNGNQTPFFVYAGSNSPEHKAETARHRGQGCTNNPQELFREVMSALLKQG